MWGLLTAMSGIGQFLYDWQTLIGSGLALVAAYVAVKPVYAQLELTRTQSNGVLREMLLSRQLEVEQAGAAIMKHVAKPIRDLSIFLEWNDDDIGEHDAFGHWQLLGTAEGYLRGGYRWRDSEAVEAAKANLLDKIDALLTILNDVHAPAHTDQSGEDYSMSDEAYAAFRQRGVDAKKEVEPACGAAWAALLALRTAQENDETAIHQQLRKLDSGLIART